MIDTGPLTGWALRRLTNDRMVGIAGFAELLGPGVLAEEHRTDVSALSLSKSKGNQLNAGDTVINCDGNDLGVSKFDRVQPRGSRTRSYR